MAKMYSFFAEFDNEQTLEAAFLAESQEQAEMLAKAELEKKIAQYNPSWEIVFFDVGVCPDQFFYEDGNLTAFVREHAMVF